MASSRGNQISVNRPWGFAVSVEYSLVLKLAGEDISTLADENNDLLGIMRGAGLAVRKSCRNGVCGLCKCRLVRGQITYHWRQPHGLWEKHIAEGLILPCIAFARSDLMLDRIPLVEDES